MRSWLSSRFGECALEVGILMRNFSYLSVTCLSLFSTEFDISRRTKVENCSSSILWYGGGVNLRIRWCAAVEWLRPPEKGRPKRNQLKIRTCTWENIIDRLTRPFQQENPLGDPRHVVGIKSAGNWIDPPLRKRPLINCRLKKNVKRRSQ